MENKKEVIKELVEKKICFMIGEKDFELLELPKEKTTYLSIESDLNEYILNIANKSIRVSGIEIKKVVEDIIDENEIIIIKNCEEFPIQAVIAFTIAVESRSNKQLIFVSEKREYRLATNKALSDRIVILSQ